MIQISAKYLTRINITVASVAAFLATISTAVLRHNYSGGTVDNAACVRVAASAAGQTGLVTYDP